MNNIALNFEIKRKMFHLCAIIFPIFYIFISTKIMCTILFIIVGIVLYLDTYRYYNKKVKGVIEKFFGKFMRLNEKSSELALSGSSYMALGFLITCLFFDKGLTITSWFILIISDFIASIFGIKFGSPLFNGKSYVGTIAFFVSAIFISIMSYFIIGYNTSFLIIIISSFFTTMAEFFAKQIKIDDNLSIPFVYSFCTTIFKYILY